MNEFLDMARHSPCAIFAVDGRHRVAFWNRSCESLTGVLAGEAVGKPCYELLRGTKPNGELLCGSDCPACQMVKGGLPMRNLSMRIQTRGGSRVQLNVGTMLMPAQDAESWMVVHFMRRGRGKAAAASAADAAMGGPLRDGGPQGIVGESTSGGACQLTERELEILRFLDQGLTTEALSETLHISKTTVRNHVQRLLAKLSVHSRIEALNHARRHHLV